MARVAVIGEPLRIHGYGLAGAMLCPASTQAEAVSAWRELPEDVAVAVLTPSAARWLATEIARRPGVLPVLLPEPSPVDLAQVLPESITPGLVLPEPTRPEPTMPGPTMPEPTTPGPTTPGPTTPGPTTPGPAMPETGLAEPGGAGTQAPGPPPGTAGPPVEGGGAGEGLPG